MEKGLTSTLKKISGAIESGRKGIEGDEDMVHNLKVVKNNFGELDGVIKGQAPMLEQMRNFSKEVASESSKNL